MIMRDTSSGKRRVGERSREWGKVTARGALILMVAMLVSLSFLPGSPFRFAIAQVSGYSDLQIGKTTDEDGPLATGEQFDYLVTVVNLGPDADTGVVVTDTLPDLVAYVSDTCSASSSYDGPSHTWTWTVGNLAASASVQCSIRVEILSGVSGEVINSVEVTGDNSDSAQGNNQTQTTGLQAFAVEVPVADYRGLIVFIAVLALAALVLLRRTI